MAEPTVIASGPAPSVPSVAHNMLINAISSGSVDSVRQLITEQPELINMFGWHRQTALHRACLIGYVDIVRLLLDSGADPNARNNFDETPLHYACKRGLPPILKCMLEKGGDVTLVDKLGKGMIHHAAEAGSVPALHLLDCLHPEGQFSYGDNNLQTPLHLAVKGGKLETFKYLLKNGRSKLKIADKDGNWPIHISAQEGYGHMTWSQLCILGLPAVHVVNKHGCTPLDLANMYDTASHRDLASELKWHMQQADTGSVKKHAYLLWFFYLFLPLLSYGAAIVLTHLMPGYHAVVFFPVVLYNVRTIKNNSHRMYHVSRWPQPIHAGAFAAGLFYSMLAYLVIILPHMGSYPTLRLLNFALAVLIPIVYLKLLTRDPGVLTSSATDEQTGKTLTLVDVCTSEKWQTFCTDCEMVRPLFTKHCKLCERCMLGMDHHCLFLLRCIAGNNHVLFVWFILLCILCMALFLAVVCLYVVQVYPTLHFFELCKEMAHRDSWVLTMFLLNCVSLVWGISLLVYQYNMISNGYTAYFQPKGAQGNLLSDFEKVKNVVYFLMNRRPHGVNPCVFGTQKTEIV